ncbi:dual serine/threonine and tyrosine protein kinase-like [Branchiostoma lanceolatum]|uniref:dual serine/threonine and tyrosine protein kinase-like n=1 Tax=Branchiostoma lanceolatum TaxID=7740 RepID=UPI0034564E47
MQLGRLLWKCKDQGARSDLEQFDPRKAIFVLNKWDQVPTKEREEVKVETIRKLGMMWGGLTESQEAVKGGFRSADFNKVLDGIYELLPQTLNHKLSVQRMANILEESLTFVRLKLNDAFRNLDAGERRREYREARSALSRFNEFSAHCVKEVKDFLEDEIESAVTSLPSVLHGEELKEHLSAVAIDAETDQDAIQKLCSEIEYYLLLKHQPFQNRIKAINEQFLDKFIAMITRVSDDYDEKIRPVIGLRFKMNAMFHKTPSNLSALVESMIVLASFVYSGMIITPFMPFTFPFALIPAVPVSLAIVLGVTALVMSSRENKDRSRLSDRSRRLAEEATTAMAERLKSIAEKGLERSLWWLSEFESHLQAKKDLDRCFVEDRFAETRGQMQLVSIYETQESDTNLRLGQLAMVELTEMREYEFDLDSIVGWPDPQNRIGGGSYGEVYRVQVERGESLVPAALKVGVLLYEITTEQNAWEFLTEESNLRDLRGEHIVEYYGTACKRMKTEGQPDSLKLGLVMELCDGTLEDRIVGQREHNPTWWGHDPVMKQRAFSYTQNLAVQLCEGLRTIHDAGYIHRDLKLINVLVTAGDVVKLADVGVTKREVDVTGTIIGTVIYAAPEVMGRKMYNKSADIYSLGLILWEMWYGRTIWQAMDDRGLRSLTEGESMMMPHSPDSVRPIPEWETLVRDCVSPDASRRPSALQCLQRIRDMTMEDSSELSLPTSCV